MRSSSVIGPVLLVGATSCAVVSDQRLVQSPAESHTNQSCVLMPFASADLVGGGLHGSERASWGPRTDPQLDNYFLPLLPDFGAAWLSAEPAAAFDALLVRPSRSTFDAALAASAPVFRPATTITSSRR